MNEQIVDIWLARAKGDLLLANVEPTEDMFYEDFCFHAQQCAEKALKALLIYLDKDFPRTHAIERLLNIIISEGIEIPEYILDSVILSDYAVKSRYPGEYELINEIQYSQALLKAQEVYAWVLTNIENKLKRCEKD